MLRSVAAVLMGYLLFALARAALTALSGQEPHAPAFMAITILYGLFFSILAGYVAAVVAGAGKYEIEHAFAVATLIAAIGAASLMAAPPAESKWTQLSVVLIIAPAAILGGYFRRRQIRAKLVDVRRSRHQ